MNSSKKPKAKSGSCKISTPTTPRVILHLDTKEEWERALKWVEANFNKPKLGSPDGDRLDILVDAIVDYEDRHYPFDEATGDDV